MRRDGMGNDGMRRENLFSHFGILVLIAKKEKLQFKSSFEFKPVAWTSNCEHECEEDNKSHERAQLEKQVEREKACCDMNTLLPQPPRGSAIVWQRVSRKHGPL